ncbi:hypothetical protein N599_02065 [Saccharopolyspora erythraea D]|nr:hypothetical protein N599_02065 [Saccharopolyspora erythraea D]
MQHRIRVRLALSAQHPVEACPTGLGRVRARRHQLRTLDADLQQRQAAPVVAVETGRPSGADLPVRRADGDARRAQHGDQVVERGLLAVGHGFLQLVLLDIRAAAGEPGASTKALNVQNRFKA